jgi:hypothetical protein
MKMNRRTSVAALSNVPQIDLAERYLQLRRLRQIVQEAERLRVPHVELEASEINPQRRRQSSSGSLTARR